MNVAQQTLGLLQIFRIGAHLIVHQLLMVDLKSQPKMADGHVQKVFL